MKVQTHLIPTYPSVDDVVQELSLIGLTAQAVPIIDPEDGFPWGESIELLPDAARQIIAWCQAEWDRRQGRGAS